MCVCLIAIQNGKNSRRLHPQIANRTLRSDEMRRLAMMAKLNSNGTVGSCIKIALILSTALFTKLNLKTMGPTHRNRSDAKAGVQATGKNEFVSPAMKKHGEIPSTEKEQGEDKENIQVPIIGWSRRFDDDAKKHIVSRLAII